MDMQLDGLRLPQRPDASVLNEAIPLFYIGRNRNGLWVAREAEGRAGGIFLTRRAAAQFAEESYEPSGCATMFVTEPLELDLVPGHAKGDAAESVSPLSMSIAGLIAVARTIFAKIGRVLASGRLHRQAIERDLFAGRYTLCSKSDDDFPVVR
jgi:hypothetical protein